MHIYTHTYVLTHTHAICYYTCAGFYIILLSQFSSVQFSR